MRESPRRPTKIRHLVLWLTVIAYMITYMDRAVIAAGLFTRIDATRRIFC